MPPRVVAMAASLVCLAGGATAARAGDVVITLDVPKESPEPPVVTRGFVARKANPLMPTRRHDPRPHVAVFLEAIDVPEIPADDKGAILGGVKAHFLVDAFAEPTIAVSAGTEIDIVSMQNTALSPRLYSPQDPNLLKAADESINPGSTRTIKPTKPLQLYEIRSRDTGHLVGRVIAFPHRYAAAQRDGRFTMKNVAPGKWKVRIWHDAGFIKMDEPVIEVGKRGDVSKSITLPATLVAAGAR